MKLKDIVIIKRDGSVEPFNKEKIRVALRKAYKAAHVRYTSDVLDGLLSVLEDESIDKNT